MCAARKGIVINTGPSPHPAAGRPGRRPTGPTGDRPGRAGAGVADRAGRRAIGADWPRSSPASAPRSRSSRRGRGCCLEEPEASELIQRVFRASGIAVRTEALAERISYDGRRFTVHLGGEAHPRSDCGQHRPPRRPSRARRRRRRVGPRDALHPDDGWMRAADGLWAIGDITGKGAFTHMSMYQADIVVRDILDQGGPPADYRAVPRSSSPTGDRQRGPDRGAGPGGRAAGAHRRHSGAVVGPG